MNLKKYITIGLVASLLANAQTPSLVNSDQLAAETSARTAADLLLREANPGLMEDFTDSTRWAENAVITNNVTQPLIGPDKFWLNLSGTTSPVPKIQTRGYGAGANEQLWYLGSSVPTANGKMSLGFQFELRKNPTTVSSFNNIMNISFSNTAMMNPSTGAIDPSGVVHINFDRNGVQGIGFYGGASITCVNATFGGSFYPWNTNVNYPSLPLDRPFAILLKVDGDYLTVSVPGVGSLIFYHADISTKIGSEKTYFWYEDTRDNDYSSMGFLNKIWGGIDCKLDYDPAWGGFVGGAIPGLNSNAYHVLPGTVISNPANPKSVSNTGGLYMSDTIPDIGYSYKGAAASATSNLANGGNAIIEGGYISNVGSTAVGGAIFARAPSNVASGITTTISSAAGLETTIKQFNRVPTLANSDSQALEIYGQLVGASAKKIKLDYATYGGTIFDSDVSGTPLDAISGPYKITVRRFSISGAGSLSYATMQLPDGTFLPTQRLSSNLTTEYSPINFKTTTVSAGGVTIDGALLPVDKVINR